MATKRGTKPSRKVKSLPVKSVSSKQTQAVKGGRMDDESPKERLKR